MKKRLLTVLLSLCMALTLLPVTALAGAVEYGVFINGVQFTASRTTMDCGGGTAVLNVTTDPYTLTLDNATVVINNSDNAGLESRRALRIVLIGSSSITCDYPFTDLEGGTTNLANDAMKLGGNTTIEAGASGASLTLSTAGGSRSGIFMYSGQLTVKSGTITASNTDGSLGFGVFTYSDPSISVTGGTLVCSGPTAVYGSNISAENADVLAGEDASSATVWNGTTSMSSYSYVRVSKASWMAQADTAWYTGDDATFTLATPQELAGLAKLVNDESEENDFEGKTITLGGDIDLTGLRWTPIGSSIEKAFRGSFIGGGHKISGMKISTDSLSDSRYAGLFGYTSDAEIRDLSVSGNMDVEISYKRDPKMRINERLYKAYEISVMKGATQLYAGGVAGLAERTHLENCHSAVDMTLSAEKVMAGGITGLLRGESPDTIVSCSNSGGITANGGTICVGGIAGEVQYDTIRNSCNTGELSAEANSTAAVGGIAGCMRDDSRVYNCYNRGEISAAITDESSEALAVGGIVGKKDSGGVVSNCYSYSKINDVYDGSYWPDAGEPYGKTPAELKALTPTLNEWVAAQNAAQDNIDAGVSYKTWYTSSVYNDGYPCFERYVPPVSYDPPTNRVPVLIDGVRHNIGTANTAGGVTTVTVDQTRLQRQLDSAADSVVIPVSAGVNAAAARLVVKNVEDMAEKDMTLSVTSGGVSYDIPAGAIDTAALLKALGAADSAKAPLTVTIKRLAASDVTLQKGTLALPPLEFTITASYGGETVDITRFDSVVSRSVEITAEQAARITTAVVVESGAQRHVPTEVFQKDGKWYARINSLSNSVYALICSEVSFADDDGKWYEAAAAEMAGRGVIGGYSDGTFGGERSITRAQFAAILTRALGLPQDSGSGFTDVAEGAWYAGAVGAASVAGIIGGYSDGSFRPGKNITRQEAMAMLHRAAKRIGFAGSSGSLAAFSDASGIGAWALEAAQWSVGSGLIKGGSTGLLRGGDSITRGETAVVLLRLLQKAGLVDVRSKT